MTVNSEEAAKYEVTTKENDIIQQAKAIALKALNNKGSAISCPAETRTVIKDYLQVHQIGRKNEFFGVLFLDTRNFIIKFEEMFQGTINETNVYARVVLTRCLELNAAAAIVVHNHPSGVSEPSQADLSITRKLRDALSFVDIRLLDHFIASDSGVVSLAERGLV